MNGLKSSLDKMWIRIHDETDNQHDWPFDSLFSFRSSIHHLTPPATLRMD